MTSNSVRDLRQRETGQMVFLDTRLSGFGLQVGKTKKTYLAEKRVVRGTRRVTIGCAKLLSCELARRKAQRIMGKTGGRPDLPPFALLVRLTGGGTPRRLMAAVRGPASASASPRQRQLSPCKGDSAARAQVVFCSGLRSRRRRRFLASASC